MKKLFYAIISIILLCNLIACNKKDSVSKSKEEFFLKEAIHLTQNMDILAESKEYQSFMASPDETELVMNDIGSQNYQSPYTIYIMEYPNDILTQLGESFGNERSDLLSKMSDTVLDKINSGLNANTFSNILNSSAGSQALVASSMLTWGKSYQKPEDWTKNTMVLLLYDGNYSSLVSFIESGEGIISASANFVKNNDLLMELKTSNDVSVIFEKNFGIKGLKYKVYSSTELEDILQK